MRRAWALGAVLLLSASTASAEEGEAVPPPAAPAPAVPEDSMLAVRVAPEWGYRRFADSEPSSTDKHYVASGFLAVSARADVYPFRARTDFWHNAGVFGSYGRALGLRSFDLDAQPVPADVDTTFYFFDMGFTYRLAPSSTLGVTLGAAFERWVFDFDDPSLTFAREVPTARYSIARAGGDAKWALGPVSLVGDAELLGLFSIAPLGDRDPNGGGFGARAKLGVAIDPWPMMTVDLGGAYTLFTFRLRSVPGRADAPGRVIDQYLVASLGVTVRW